MPFDKNKNFRTDAKAFLFSLDKQMICKLNGKNNSKAIHDYSSYYLTFGGGHDFSIKPNCNTNTNSYSNLGHTYDPPSEYKGEKKSFFAGQKNF